MTRAIISRDVTICVLNLDIKLSTLPYVGETNLLFQDAGYRRVA